MLDDLDISIKEINTTDYDKLGSALADSVALGLTPKRGAKLLQNVVILKKGITLRYLI